MKQKNNMKILIKILSLALLLNSCINEIKVVDTRVVRGVISAKDEGHRGRFATLPKFYVQSSKETVTIDVPFADEDLFKIGDTICVVVKTIEKVK
jgi:hypothetical protein